MKHSHFKKLALSQLAIYLLAASSIATAQPKVDGATNTDGPFLLADTSAGKAIKEATGATVFGLMQAGYSMNDVTSSADKKKSRSNTIAGPSDEGPQFNGMILAIETRAASGGNGTAVKIAGGMGLRAYRHAISRGVVLRPLGDVLYWMPPYCVGEEELLHLADVTTSALTEAFS